jgi:hypothetical protein
VENFLAFFIVQHLLLIDKEIKFIFKFRICRRFLKRQCHEIFLLPVFLFESSSPTLLKTAEAKIKLL